MHKGLNFGEWTIVSDDFVSHPSGYRLANVKCSCGASALVRTSDLKGGKSKGCKACANREKLKKINIKGRKITWVTGGGGHPKHGGCGTQEYGCWQAMKNRCNNKRNKTYLSYGGKGIRVCDRWEGEDGFINFLADMGKRPSPKHSIDRIDNDKGYYPENCRWATTLEQLYNRSVTKKYMHKGEKLTSLDIMNITGLNRETIRQRISKGWSLDEILKYPFPIQGGKRKTKGDYEKRRTINQRKKL